ncbi:hypothetical protein ACIGB6_19755 [Paeniglutamicibacter gangotriensis]|uniref:hypothetical protein n=1 Tax=Paeniglutamicibacter gangotriensis TaxID=254787 RepID=UPI0037C8344C
MPEESDIASDFNFNGTRRPAAKDHDHALSANRCTDGMPVMGDSWQKDAANNS